jgi:ABC-type sugar transport system permease subunit
VPEPGASDEGIVSSDGLRSAFVIRASRRRATDLLFLAPVLVVLGIFLGYPLVYGLDLSLHRTIGFEVTGPITLENYVRALAGDSVFQQGLVNTLAFTAAAVVLQVGLGLLLAHLVLGVRRGRAILQLAFIAPFVLATVAVGAVWKFVYAPFFGVIPSLGSAMGLDVATVAPLADPTTALWAILVAFLWRFAGFAMVVYAAAIQGIPRELYEVADLEGAGPVARLRRITWPLLWPQTFALVLLTTIATLRIFDMVWIMTAGGPAHATETVATLVYTTAFRSVDVGSAQAMAVILMGIILALAVIEYRLMNSRTEAGAA